MSGVYKVPLSPNPQTLFVVMAGVEYRLTVAWCAPASCWVLSIADASGNAIVNGVPLLPGGDLLEQYAYLGIGVVMYVSSDGDGAVPPTYDNLGSAANLYFVER
jgi:hypothetical protein